MYEILLLRYLCGWEGDLVQIMSDNEKDSLARTRRGRRRNCVEIQEGGNLTLHTRIILPPHVGFGEEHLL